MGIADGCLNGNEGPMRLTNLVLLGFAALTASCDRAPFAMGLADGCYYVGDKPVFKIAGPRGRVLIPGEVQTFTVKAGTDSAGAYAIFSPGFYFDEADSKNDPLTVGTNSDRQPFRLVMQPGTSVPTVEMNWAAYGDENASLGKPC